MQGEVETNGGFSGTKRQNFMLRKLYGVLRDETELTSDDDILEWIEETTAWDCGFDEEHECIFASLAKALPNTSFSFEIKRSDYTMESWEHNIEYRKGCLLFTTSHYYNLHEDEDTCEWDYDWDINPLGKYEIDNEGKIADEWLSKESTEFEKEKFAKWLRLIETGADAPADLMILGMLYETGLAGVEKKLTSAWACYLKAAETGDNEAIVFVDEIFSDECKEERRQLLAGKCIGKESYPLFCDLAARKNSAELTAEILEYGRILNQL